LILARARAIGALFSVLTVAWIAVDAATFDRSLYVPLAIGRIVTGTALGTLAWWSRPTASAVSAGIALGALFALPLAFFTFGATILADANIGHHLVWLGTTYIFLPFVIAAGVGIFPLTLIEAVALGAPVLIVTTAVSLAARSTIGQVLDLGMLWLLFLVLGVAAIAAMSQLQFLVAFVRQTSRDPLTGLLNRRVGEALIEAQFAVATRQNVPLSTLFIDLDNFKEVNDRHGHDAGDQLLREVADSLSSILRAQDVAVRWGGEEFLVVLPHTDREGARLMIQRLAQHGLARRLDGRAQMASIGVAEWPSDPAPTWMALTTLADQRMYAAKQAGRNRVGDGNSINPFISDEPEGAPRPAEQQRA